MVKRIEEDENESLFETELVIIRNAKRNRFNKILSNLGVSPPKGEPRISSTFIENKTVKFKKATQVKKKATTKQVKLPLEKLEERLGEGLSNQTGGGNNVNINITFNISGDHTETVQDQIRSGIDKTEQILMKFKRN